MYKPLTFTDEELEEFTKAAIVASGDYVYPKHLETYGWWDDFSPPQAVLECDHDWKKESFFSNNVYETCTKCDEKKEDT